MSTTLIRDIGLELTRGATTLVVSPITLTTGRTLADWSSFVLTAREDPLWPRRGTNAAKNVVEQLDPSGDGWAVAASIAGAVAGATLEFDIPAGTLEFGRNRFAVDVYGVGGTAGDSPLVSATWLSVVPDVR